MSISLTLRSFCLPLAMLTALLITQPLAAQATARTAELQSLVERAARHLALRKENLMGSEMGYRARRATLQQTLEAWNNSARTDEDADAMEAWLTTVINASMVGGRGPMPTPPEFQPAPKPAAPAIAPETIPAGPARETANRPPRDAPAPFEPDPIDASEPFGETPEPHDNAAAASEPERPEPAAAAPPADAWSQHPAAGRLDWSNPFADDPPAGQRSRAAGKRFKPVSQSRSVKVDLLELSSRVAGYNSRLRELEGLLVGAKNLSAFRLAAILRDLDELHDQRGFLELYLTGLSPDEAAVGPNINSSEAIHRLIREAVRQRNEALSGSRDSRAEAETAILAALERKLNELERE